MNNKLKKIIEEIEDFDLHDVLFHFVCERKFSAEDILDELENATAEMVAETFEDQKQADYWGKATFQIRECIKRIEQED